MTLDLVCLGVLTLCAVLGALSGALAQTARLAAVAAAAVLGRPLATLLAPVIVDNTGLPAGFASPIALALSCALVYLVLHFVAVRIARAFTENRDVRAVDRSVGAFFGALQAAVLVWVVLSILVGIEDKVRIPLGAEGSFAASVARDHNFFVALREEKPPPKPTRSAAALDPDEP